MAAGLSAELRAALEQTFEQLIPFNAHLGLEVVHLAEDRARLAVTMRPELVGNPVKQILHGGVISATLDVAGGIAAMAALLARQDLGAAGHTRLFERFGTIDLRVDFLRPGQGERFEAVAYPMRIGSTVAVTRMEFHNAATGALVAVGTGTYIVG